MGRPATEAEVSALTDVQCFERAKQHCRALTQEFDGEPVLVAIEAIAMFLYELWFDVLQAQGMTFEEFASNVGRYMGALHLQREKARRGMH